MNIDFVSKVDLRALIDKVSGIREGHDSYGSFGPKGLSLVLTPDERDAIIGCIEIAFSSRNG